MLRYLRPFYDFWYDFLIGDDWTVAAGIVALFIVVAALPVTHAAAWIFVPVIVVLLLGFSVWRLAAEADRRG